jgi:epoxyqueuosine reductase QueG
VKGYGLNAGASVVGIASSNDFDSAPECFRPADHLDGCLSVVVLGVPFSRDALESSARYTEVRRATIERTNEIAKEVMKKIKTNGYKTMVVGCISGKFIDGMTHGPISLKHAAELAGLGDIGRNYLLINPEYGTLLWFSAVLTDAPLLPDRKVRHGFCDNCNKCVDACPSKALDDYPVSFGKKKCANTCFKYVDKKWMLSCFLCRSVCPHRFGK